MEYTQIIVEKRGKVGVVRLNRPARRNAVSLGTLEELERAFDALGADSEIGAVVITGEGDKAFCAGADLEEGFGEADVEKAVRLGQKVFQKISRFPLPVVAAVNGYALGGGFELMMSCDLVVAAENAAMGQPEVNRGIIPGWGGTQLLPRLVSRQRAMEILMLGGRMRAKEAEAMGLVNRVVEKGKEMETAMELAERLARAPREALRLVKDAAVRGAAADFGAGLEIEAGNFVAAYRASGLGGGK